MGELWLTTNYQRGGGGERHEEIKGEELWGKKSLGKQSNIDRVLIDWPKKPQKSNKWEMKFLQNQIFILMRIQFKIFVVDGWVRASEARIKQLQGYKRRTCEIRLISFITKLKRCIIE